MTQEVVVATNQTLQLREIRSTSGPAQKPLSQGQFQRGAIWDAQQMVTTAAGSKTSSALTGHQAPRFQLEPPPLVEYSNSTGTVIPCRPSPTSGGSESQLLSAAASGKQALQRLPVGSQTSISWLQVEGLDHFQVNEWATPRTEQRVAPGKGGRRYVRLDGSLVISPFKAGELDKGLHSSIYRCCLTNKFGQLCSRPVRTRAGKSHK